MGNNPFNFAEDLRKLSGDDKSTKWKTYRFLTHISILLGLYLVIMSFQELTHDNLERSEGLQLLNNTPITTVSSIAEVDATLEGKVLFFQGKVTTKQRHNDKYFDFPLYGLGVFCDVFFYQWRTTSGKGAKVFRAWVTWFDPTVTFQDEVYVNTITYSAESYSKFVSDASVGAYIVDTDLVVTFPKREAPVLPLDYALRQKIQKNILQYAQEQEQDQHSESMQAFLKEPEKYGDIDLVSSNNPNEIYMGIWKNDEPLIGDVLMRYTVIPEQEVSFFAMLQGNTLQHAVLDNGFSTSGLIASGKVSIEEILSSADKENTMAFRVLWVDYPLVFLFLIRFELYMLRLHLVRKDGSKVLVARHPWITSLCMTCIMVAYVALSVFS